jgi:hypothetical protein
MEQTLEDEIVTGMSRCDLPWGGSISAGGAPAASILEGLDNDDGVGAVAGDYHRGNYVVHINRYEIGHSLRKIPLPTSRFRRWLVVRRILRGGGPFRWAYQANFGGAGCASSTWTRDEAIKDSRKWIDEQIVRRGAEQLVEDRS